MKTLISTCVIILFTISLGHGQGQYFIKGETKSETKNTTNSGVPKVFTSTKIKDLNYTEKRDNRAAQFFENFEGSQGNKLLQNGPVSLSYGFQSQVIVSSELLSARIGNWRLAFGSVVASNPEKTTDEEVNSDDEALTFFNGGGNAFLQFTNCLIYRKLLHSSDNGNGQFLLLFNPKVQANLPQAESTKENDEYAIDIGLEWQLSLGSSENEIGLIYKGRLAAAVGSELYMSQISKNNGFLYLQNSAGLMLGNMVLINLSFRPAITKSVTKMPTTIGVQLKF